MTRPWESVSRPTLNTDAVQRAALAVGHAVWGLQSLEDAIAAHLTLTRDVEPGCAVKELEAALVKRRKMTFGQLLNAQGLGEHVPEEVMSRLAALKEERNWLIHQSRRDAHVSLYTTSGAQAVLDHVDRIGGETSQLGRLVVDATAAYLRSVGISFAPALVEETLRHWERGERHSGEIGHT